jgi:hypothetical protein
MPLLNISTLIHSRRAQIAVAVVVPLVVIAMAVPSFLGGSTEPAGTSDLAPPQPTVAQVEPAQTDGVADQAPEDLGPVPHDGGDIELSVGLRFDRYPAGSVIRAEVELVNMSLSPVFLPGPSEPQPTLTIVVLDEEGQTVRRVVEDSGDATPRRMRLLKSGASTRFRIDVVTRDEDPLTPGTYHLVASYASNPAWNRTGLPVWSAPLGIRHSDRVALEVTPSQ